jgi:hypothetical protein
VGDVGGVGGVAWRGVAWVVLCTTFQRLLLQSICEESELVAHLPTDSPLQQGAAEFAHFGSVTRCACMHASP